MIEQILYSALRQRGSDVNNSCVMFCDLLIRKIAITRRKLSMDSLVDAATLASPLDRIVRQPVRDAREDKSQEFVCIVLLIISDVVHRAKLLHK